MNQAASAIGCEARGRAPRTAPGGRSRRRGAESGAAPTRAKEARHRGTPGARVCGSLLRETLRPGSAQPAVSPECPKLGSFSFPGVPPSARAVRARGACSGPRASSSPPFLKHLAGSSSARRAAQGCTPLPRVPGLPGYPFNVLSQSGSDTPTWENLFHSRSPRAAAAS